MKKYFAILGFLMLTVSAVAQQKFTVPVTTSDQKHGNIIYQFWFAISSGINFARAHGVEPYDYGKYMGKLAAPSWGEGNNFEAYGNSMIYVFEELRYSSDSALIVKENPDGSLSIITEEKMWHRYFTDDNHLVTYQDFLEFMKGLNEPIAEHMGAKVKIEVLDNKFMCTLSKK